MKTDQRPLSPFMIGPYYKPQMTSIMSITHRATGVFLSVIGAPLFLWWIIATAGGAESFAVFERFAASLPGKAVLAVSVLCLFYHLLNGIRHLVWDTGRALEIRSAYTAGWMVLIATAVLGAAVLGVTL
ncbi:MAG: succinate dehydrogenase, cytochrome b556 subunit [Xanthomonadales bacterium]|jgi:succinate dehydrogenase / fumarate reductase cytochrome b subunit|nr:succinate dehydrogenase, cytochrome b556 subunit [Xanthomonadales bacterium]